jgi:hypothetical protein
MQILGASQVSDNNQKDINYFFEEEIKILLRLLVRRELELDT